jgi:hypothetical protein
MNVAGFYSSNSMARVLVEQGIQHTLPSTIVRAVRRRRFNKMEPSIKTILLVNKRGMAVTEGKPEIEDKTRNEPTIRQKSSHLLKREPWTASQGSASAIWTASRGSVNGSREIYYSVTRALSSLR